jgi:hypothetical protein
MSRADAMKQMNIAIANCTDEAARAVLVKHRHEMPAFWASQDAAAAKRMECPRPWLGRTGAWL